LSRPVPLVTSCVLRFVPRDIPRRQPCRTSWELSTASAQHARPRSFPVRVIRASSCPRSIAGRTCSVDEQAHPPRSKRTALPGGRATSITRSTCLSSS
jgi:hypothetical protein